MPLAVKCECGSQLEIDEKFLGKEILCPDCQRPLPTKAPTTPPPLDIPEFRRTSGLAILSLSIAIVGFFTFIGSIAAIVVGVVALKKIAQRPTKLDGAGFARAGIVTGAAGLALSLILLFLPSIFIEAYVRHLQYAGRLEFPVNKTVARSADNESISIDRPSGDHWSDWGVYQRPNSNLGQSVKLDQLILVNLRENAFISSQRVSLNQDDINGDYKKAGLERLRQSELFNILGRLRGQEFPAERMPADDKKEEKKDDKGKKEAKKDKTGEYVFAMNIGGVDRKFLMRWHTIDNNTKLTILVASAPANRFDRLEKDIKESFEKATVK